MQLLKTLAKSHLQIAFTTSIAPTFLRRYTKSFAASMAEALEKVEQQEVKQRLERQAAESDINKFKKEKRLLKRRKWVDWQSDRKTEDANDTNADNKRIAFDPLSRVKRKKCAILLGYCGANFYGMQRNPGMPTIEDELFKAMRKHKWITDESYDQAQLACFQRAARTDKGVSALRQVCSIKLPENLDIPALNMDLPPEIRLFSVERVTKGFNAKDQCNARTYAYTMPSIAFDCFTNKTDIETFRISEEKLQEVREVLKHYEGTKNFHNFTRKKRYLDPSVKRYIISMECSDPFIAHSYDVEFVTIKVKGQSFMMHQIRKMVGLTIAICRGHTDLTTMEKAFSDQKLDIPRAPGLGLVLDNVHYERYNDRYGDDGIHQPLTWSQQETEIADFAENKIYSKIYEIEHKERPMLDWLTTLFKHTYDVRTDDNSLDTTTTGDDDEEDE